MSVKKKSNNKELDDAIDQIPGLILEEIGRKYAQEQEETDAKTQTRTSKQARIYHPPHRSKTWLWVGVSIFTVCILALWGLNISTMLYENGTTDDPLLSKLKENQQNFGSIMSTFGDDASIADTTGTTTQEVAGESTSSAESADTADKEENSLENKLKHAMSSLFATSTATSTEINTST
jgi:hypothetical protein